MIDETPKFPNYSAYAAWMRNLERVLYASGRTGDTNLELYELRGLSYCFDPGATSNDDLAKLRRQSRHPIKSGQASSSPGTDYVELLRAPKAGLSLHRIIDKLRQDSQSKSAVAQFFVDDESKPCLSTLDFKIREEKLEVTAFFRSQDVWRRQPDNIIFLIDCSLEVARAVGVKPGLIRAFVSSAHIYAIDADDASRYFNNASVDLPRIRPIAVAVVGREKPHGDLPEKPWAYEWAFGVGAGLAAKGFVLVTGGLGGIMEAACRGAASGGGVVIGIAPAIPESEASKRSANPYQTLVIQTGLDQRARIPIIVNSCDAMIAINGGAGTRIEVELFCRYYKIQKFKVKN